MDGPLSGRGDGQRDGIRDRCRLTRRPLDLRLDFTASRAAAARGEIAAGGPVFDLERVAVLDFETDPFDNQDPAEIRPFLAVLWTSHSDPVVIWKNPAAYNPIPPGCRKPVAPDRYQLELQKFAEAEFLDELYRAFDALPGRHYIYAHNGGRFDYKFMLSRIRGEILMRGTSSIMEWKYGGHLFRDSYHIIPTSLARANKKDEISYAKLKRDVRDINRAEIERYCIHDCQYTHEVVVAFLKEFGPRATIGQAAMRELRKTVKTKKIGKSLDEILRPYYFGGRVECLEGAGHFRGNYKLYDVNSMYPHVMAHMLHPIGNATNYTVRHTNLSIEPHTVFIRLSCKNERAFVSKQWNSELKLHQLTSECKEGEFRVSIHEYRMAEQLGLISDVRLIEVIDCDLQTNFASFVLPRYERRAEIKELLQVIETGNLQYIEVSRESLFIKLVLNNAYGKFGQNPDNFMETHIVDYDADYTYLRSGGWTTQINSIHGDYTVIARRKEDGKLNNVGTAASITGGSRAVLMNGLYHAIAPIYCDTDSILCEGLSGVPMHPSELGAWSKDGEFTDAYIAGKKAYCLEGLDPAKTKTSWKGSRFSEGQIKQIVVDDCAIPRQNDFPTFGMNGLQLYQVREGRRTARKRAIT